MQVLGKDPDGLDVGPVGQLVADLPLQGGKEQPLPGVLAGGLHLAGGGGAGADAAALHLGHRLFLRGQEVHLQELLPLAPVHRQNPVGGHAGHRLPVIIIHGVDAVLFLGGLGFHHALPQQQLPQDLPQGGVVADGFRQDVPGPGQSGLGVGHLLLRIHIFRGLGFRIPLGQMHHQPQGQGLQPPLLGDGGPGAALRPEGAVDILQLGEGGGFGQIRPQLLGEDALIRQGLFNFPAALVQIPQIIQPFGQLPQHLIVQGAGLFLAVPGDEGDGVPLVQQADDRGHLLGPQLEFLRQQGGVSFLIHASTPFPIFLDGSRKIISEAPEISSRTRGEQDRARRETGKMPACSREKGGRRP